jgi:hypothetical protein
MQNPLEIDITNALYILLLLVGGALGIALLLLGWVIWRVRRIHLPSNADLLTALRLTPFVVVVLLDLLDFSLDFLSAPIAWVLLGRLGLTPLRGVTVLEELVPGTQLVPTMTAAWVIARLLGPRQTP